MGEGNPSPLAATGAGGNVSPAAIAELQPEAQAPLWAADKQPLKQVPHGGLDVLRSAIRAIKAIGPTSEALEADISSNIEHGPINPTARLAAETFVGAAVVETGRNVATAVELL